MSNELATPEAPAAPIVATPEPAAPVVPVTPTAPVVAAEPISLPVDDRLNLTHDQRKGLLFGRHAPAAEKPVEAAPVTPVVEPPPAPVEAPAVAAPVVPVTPAASAAQIEDELDPEAGFTKNFRLHTDDPRHSAFLKAYKAITAVNPKASIADIARSVGLEETPVVPTNIPGIVEPPQVPAEIVAARAAIAEIEAKIDGAFSNEELTKPEQAALIKQLGAKNRELSTLEMRHEIAAQRQTEMAQQQGATARQQEMQAVDEAYPALTDPDSDLSLELDRQFFAITGNRAHPDFQKVNAEGFPAYLAEQATQAVAARLMKKNPGMTEAQAAAAVKGSKPAAVAPVSPVAPTPPVQPTKPQPAPVPRTVLVTAPGGQQAPAAVTLSIEQIREQAARDPHFRKRALGFTGDRVVA